MISFLISFPIVALYTSGCIDQVKAPVREVSPHRVSHRWVLQCTGHHCAVRCDILSSAVLRSRVHPRWRERSSLYRQPAGVRRCLKMCLMFTAVYVCLVLTRLHVEHVWYATQNWHMHWPENWPGKCIPILAFQSCPERTEMLPLCLLQKGVY